MMRLLLAGITFLLSVTFALAQIPDAPQPQANSSAQGCYVSARDGATMCPAVVKGDTWKEFSGKDAGFWTFRKSYNFPPLRTTRQHFHSKSILVSEAAAWASLSVACGRRKTSHESWDSEVPALIGVMGMAYVGDRFFARPYAVFPMIYAGFHYAQSAAK